MPPLIAALFIELTARLISGSLLTYFPSLTAVEVPFERIGFKNFIRVENVMLSSLTGTKGPRK